MNSVYHDNHDTNKGHGGVPSAAELPPGYLPVSLRAEDAVPLARFVAANCVERRWAPAVVLGGTTRAVAPDDDLSEAFPCDSDPDVGIRLGTPSAGLVVVRLSTPRVAHAADLFLPETGLKAGGPESIPLDLFYQSDPPPETTIWPSTDGSPFWALLSTGETVMVPRIFYPDGGPMIWGEDCLPTAVEGRQLLDALNKLTATAILAASWPTRFLDRKKAAKAMAGAMLRRECDRDDTVRLLQAVAHFAGDIGGLDPTQLVQDTVSGLASGVKVMGLPKLAGLVGEDTVRIVKQLLGMNEDDPQMATAREAAHVLTEQVKSAPGTSATVIQEALESPETLGALAFLAQGDRGLFEATVIGFREAGARTRDVDALVRGVNAEGRRHRRLRLVEPGEEPEEVRVKDVLPDAPVGEDVVIPEGWRLGPTTGLSRQEAGAGGDGLSSSWHTVAPTPVVIEGRMKDVAEGTEAVRLSWVRDGHWQHHVVDRATVASARNIVELAGLGLPVTSSTSSLMVEYLADFEAVNILHLPRAHVSGQMGWQGNGGEGGFLWGRHLIRPDGIQAGAVNLDAAAPEDWSEDFIAFRGADSGDEQIADGFHSHGSYEKWVAAAQQITQYPRVLLALYAGLSPPLLAVIGAPNFVCDWCWPTSTGKTTLLHLVASCWGNPDERSPASVIWTWDVPRVFIERASAVLNGLPLILDDTKRSKYPRQIAQVLYDVTSGRGRGRGSPQGMRRAGAYTTVLLSTGEAPAVSFTEDGGTRARALTIWGPPFGRADDTTAPVVHNLNQTLFDNYGPTFGPRGG